MVGYSETELKPPCRQSMWKENQAQDKKAVLVRTASSVWQRKTKRSPRLGCATLRLPDSRNDAELLHHAQSIPANMVVQDFSVRDANYRHALHGHCFVCGSYASQVAFVRT